MVLVFGSCFAMALKIGYWILGEGSHLLIIGFSRDGYGCAHVVHWRTDLYSGYFPDNAEVGVS